TRSDRDWSSDVCSSDLSILQPKIFLGAIKTRIVGAHVWKIHPDSLAHGCKVSLNHHVLFAPISGRKARYFRDSAFPRIKREWVRSEERRVGKECRGVCV